MFHLKTNILHSATTTVGPCRWPRGCANEPTAAHLPFPPLIFPHRANCKEHLTLSQLYILPPAQKEKKTLYILPFKNSSTQIPCSSSSIGILRSEKATVGDASCAAAF
jgi:hypothetical protein